MDRKQNIAKAAASAMSRYVVLLVAFLLCGLTYSLPLQVRSRWIVDETTGRRVKFACVNWAGHLEPVLPEGLSTQPLQYIANTISSLGFNCVRLTWAIFMVTDPTLSNLTVAQTFASLNLSSAAAGVATHNPELLGLSHIEAYQHVVTALQNAGVMVILDNHVSKPQWCCSLTDGNGFFGDQYFDPEAWIQGLKTMASRFKDCPNVVAMSLRNELRGPRANPADWYKYMEQGASAIHAANPNVLVILSGLSYDTDLSFLRLNPVSLPFKKKIVYELHWYAFGVNWKGGLPNQLCGSIMSSVKNRGGFLMDSVNETSAMPLFISEFGINQRGINENDNRYINCFLAFAAEGDFDWALWSLQGNYYLRQGQPGKVETYSVLNENWNGLRNPDFIARLKTIQQPIQDPSFSSDPLYQIIYHPATGLCLESTTDNNITLGSCIANGSRWSYNGTKGPVGLLGSSRCIGVKGNGVAPTLSDRCSSPNNTSWSVVSSSKLQIATNLSGDGSGKLLCLDGSSSPAVLTKDCICVGDAVCSSDDNPEGQWFKVISTNRKVVSESY